MIDGGVLKFPMKEDTGKGVASTHAAQDSPHARALAVGLLPGSLSISSPTSTLSWGAAGTERPSLVGVSEDGLSLCLRFSIPSCYCRGRGFRTFVRLVDTE